MRQSRSWHSNRTWRARTRIQTRIQIQTRTRIRTLRHQDRRLARIVTTLHPVARLLLVADHLVVHAAHAHLHLVSIVVRPVVHVVHLRLADDLAAQDGPLVALDALPALDDRPVALPDVAAVLLARLLPVVAAVVARPHMLDNKLILKRIKKK
jgi:hypothetical protein